jgi:hypothetical protein
VDITIDVENNKEKEGIKFQSVIDRYSLLRAAIEWASIIGITGFGRNDPSCMMYQNISFLVISVISVQ